MHCFCWASSALICSFFSRCRSKYRLFSSDRSGIWCAANRLVKSWCRETGLSGNFGSHTLRKTWGYHQRIHNHSNVALLMRAFGHATEAQTLDYLCILPDEIKALYLGLEL